jgi:hypothetical protein
MDSGMNGAEFFMKHAGYAILPEGMQTGDAVDDAEQLFSTSLPLSTGRALRLTTCWMVITERWRATSFKAEPSAGFRSDIKPKDAIRQALSEGGPFMVLEISKRKMQATDLFVTYDARAVRRCAPGEVKTVDITTTNSWIS